MRSDRVDAFEIKAKELIADAISLSMEYKKASAALPKPNCPISHCVQLAVVGFVEVTKLLLYVFRCAANDD